jgi:hypothetical protein
MANPTPAQDLAVTYEVRDICEKANRQLTEHLTREGIELPYRWSFTFNAAGSEANVAGDDAISRAREAAQDAAQAIVDEDFPGSFDVRVSLRRKGSRPQPLSR